MPVKWDDESEKNLLLCILHVLGPQAPTPNWKQVAALMGPEYTGEGIRYIQRSFPWPCTLLTLVAARSTPRA